MNSVHHKCLELIRSSNKSVKRWVYYNKMHFLPLKDIKTFINETNQVRKKYLISFSHHVIKTNRSRESRHSWSQKVRVIKIKLQDWVHVLGHPMVRQVKLGQLRIVDLAKIRFKFRSNWFQATWTYTILKNKLGFWFTSSRANSNKWKHKRRSAVVQQIIKLNSECVQRTDENSN